jgi:very-short-patch-repair endonuclease
MSIKKSKYWNYELNSNVNPRTILKTSRKKYYFNCNKCKHVFYTTLNSITYFNSWCSYCSNKKLCNDKNCNLCYKKSFASHVNAKYWNYDKNNNVNPRNIFKSSAKIYWFNCNKCTHIFETKLSWINNGSWCPYCSNPPKKLCDNNDCNICFEKSFMSNPKSKNWNYELNNNINPRNIFKKSNNKFYFNCDLCKHIFKISLDHINDNKWCPFCSNKKLCENNNCKICFEKSFISNEKSKFWNYKLNNNINPRNIFKSSHLKYWFNCNECKHSFKSCLSNINNRYSWCSYCSNDKLCEDKDCKLCFDKSFASHKNALYWNYEKNNNINPRYVFKSSADKFWFNCDKCSHNFKNRLASINDGVWCSYCSNSMLCDNNNCSHCFSKSFASHEKSKYWNYEKNNNINPRELFKNCNNKYWFSCDKCNHSFNIRLNSVNRGSFCPICINKTEKIVYEFLLENNFNIIKEATFNWCKNNKTNNFYRFDFVIESFKLIIEIDGRQHFEEVKHFKNDFKENQEKDKYKMEQAKKNGYSIIRIIQEDIYYNKYDWKSELIQNIKKYENPEIIYLCKNNEYDCYN